MNEVKKKVKILMIPTTEKESSLFCIGDNSCKTDCDCYCTTCNAQVTCPAEGLSSSSYALSRDAMGSSMPLTQLA